MSRLKPQFVAFFSCSSSGQSKDTDQKSKHGNDRWKEEKSEPLINLGLGIGGSSFCHTGSSEHRRKDNSFNRSLMVEEDDHHDVYDDDDQLVEKEGCRKCSVVRFTEEQLEELNRQLLIFKYLVWGIPVPFHLLIPLWRRFSYSSVPQHTQSSPIWIAVQALNGRRFHYQRAMQTDLQPGRCRRTDGKKWRCQQVVIPNEKYCEKHMHRGSKRSRKLVEASPNAGTPNEIRLNPNRNINSGSSKAQFLVNVDQNGSSMVMMRTPSLNNTTTNSDRNKKQHNETKSSIVSSPRSSVTNPASGFDFSPKSVLPNGMICARNEACKNSTESEPRCKRTDGKKWRCKKGVVAYQKYCEQHINRGKVRSGKPPYLGSSASRESLSALGSTSAAKSFETEVKEQIKVGLDTSLKISLPATPAEDNGSSFSSEATESDDDNTGVWEIIALSP